MPTPNFLIGYGERLVEPINPPPHGGPKTPPYLFLEARTRLIPMVQTTARELGSLPDLACPNGQAVAVLTLHPQYLAKSYYPGAMLQMAGLESVGSRPTRIQPEKWTLKGPPEPRDSTELFVAGPRNRIREWAQALPNLREHSLAGKELTSVEHLRAQRRADRIQRPKTQDRELPLEIVLHATASPTSAFIIEGFKAYLESLGLEAEFDRRFFIGGLCFLPMEAPRAKLAQIADFSFLRVLREMPRLRMLNPTRSVAPPTFACTLPTAPAQNTATRVAIFDGGLDPSSPLTRWVQPINPPNIGASVPEYLEHGHQVTSALLFGPLKSGETILPPFTNAHHYRVLDAASSASRFELYDVLDRIRNVLDSQPYEFISLSIGPDMPVEDTEVHPWTAYFDEHLSTGNALAAFAVGNGGENDRPSGNARIQVPSDSVNGLSVGASTSSGPQWRRAGYSSIGPGRSPGIVKPDILCFGGTDDDPFYVVGSQTSGSTTATTGTSFAGPAALRLGLGVRTYLGQIITPLANKALLIHCADDANKNRDEHGWGCIPHALDELIVCPNGTARVLYQGNFRPGKFVRAQIPVPASGLTGEVTIRATFCFATRTDPEDPGNYTRSGLIVVFRPHDGKRRPGAENANTAPFFQRREFAIEEDQRRDALKWETTLHAEQPKRASSLRNPIFDVHHNVREGGGKTGGGASIRYALVVSVTAPNTEDLYNKIIRRYTNRLQPLQPVITIPIRTQT